jgi:FKBP-type peptidyl-prolyl cis-trans isomerase (trigger factor)
MGVLNDKITVKVGKEDYLSSFEKTLKTYSKSANIPGFRKGMVPTGIIKKMHGQAVFTDEVLKTVEQQLTKYMTDEKLDIFAQPLPLKWMTGGAKALRTGPLPHSGQLVGPSSLMPWTTSNRRSQFAQA